jgi:LmbE family N-acetylglucosaminyl deacetylase
MQRLALDADARERKSRAIAAHASQLVATSAERRAPVLPDWALARLLRPFEVFIESGLEP